MSSCKRTGLSPLEEKAAVFTVKIYVYCLPKRGFLAFHGETLGNKIGVRITSAGKESIKIPPKGVINRWI